MTVLENTPGLAIFDDEEEAPVQVPSVAHLVELSWTEGECKCLIDGNDISELVKYANVSFYHNSQPSLSLSIRGGTIKVSTESLTVKFEQ